MPGSLLAQRAMMILACVIGSFGMIGAVASMDLVNAGMNSANARANVRLPSGKPGYESYNMTHIDKTHSNLFRHVNYILSEFRDIFE